MRSEEIDYAKWRRVVIKLQIIFGSFIFLIELINNIYLYVSRSQGYTSSNIGEKLIAYLLVPTIVNVSAIIIGYLIIKRLGVFDPKHQYVLIFTLEVISINIVLTHYQFGASFSAVLLPILCCIMYENITLLTVTSAISFLGAAAGIVVRGADKAYNQDIIGEAVIIFTEIIGVYFMMRAIVSVLNNQREYLVRAKDYEEKLVVLEQLDEKNKQLEEEQKNLRQFTDEAILALSNAVEFNDHYTNGHSKRVAEYSRQIAAKMGMDEEYLKIVYHAGLLHDVGKIGVDNAIINKDGKLSEDEYQQIKLHPTMGYHILQGISMNSRLAHGAKWHHERYDGKGYPDGLTGDNIPMIARIIAVADSYDAMTSKRSYRDTMPQEKVREEILKGKGTQFDPEVADVMLQMIDDDKNYDLRQISASNKNILIVDDDIMSLKHGERILSKQDNIKVYKAESVEEAMKTIAEVDFNLVLLDLTLPKIDGFEAYGMIREAGYKMPIVFLSGDKNIESIKKAKELGAIDYLTKPVHPDELTKVVETVIDGDEFLENSGKI